MITCSGCSRQASTKDATLFFYRDKSKKTGFCSRCKVCYTTPEQDAIANKRKRDRRKANPEKFRAREKELRLLSPWRTAANQKKWVKNNPQQTKANNAKRRARKRDNGVFMISKKFLDNLYNSPCVFCGVREDIQADHIVPLEKGGRHSEGNLQPLCRLHNQKKNKKVWVMFLRDERVVA